MVWGSLTASQSLNRYSYVQGNPVSYTDPFGLSPLNGLFTGTNFWHAVLGFIGCVPGPVGMVANLADAAVYALIDHDYGMAALAMLDCVSGGLSTLAKAATAAGKATKTARYLKTAGSLISNVSSFAQNASAGMATAFGMYEKYMIKGEEFDSSTPWEIASLGLSILGMGISGRGMAGDTKALSKMLNEDMVSSRMSKVLSRQMGGRQTGTPLEYNLQFFGGGKKGYEASKDFGKYTFKEGIDIDLRGQGTYKDALDIAFEKTGLPKEKFNVTKWGKDKNGKSFPVEWRADNGAEVNIDIGHSPIGNAPTVPHVGWQTGGKRGLGGAVRGHIFVEDVLYNRGG